MESSKLNHKQPHLYIIAGPNGAGKTTFAQEFLPHYAKCNEFVNADLIARGLSPFSPVAADLRAGRIVLEQIGIYAGKRADFAFETTLSGVTYLARLKALKNDGYVIHLFFLWIPDVKLALARIASRVRAGGHGIPDATVRRRFNRGIQNLFQKYRPLLDSWILFDNSHKTPQVIANEESGKLEILDKAQFDSILKLARSL